MERFLKKWCVDWKSYAYFWSLLHCGYILKKLEWNKEKVNKPFIRGVRINVLHFPNFVQFCDLTTNCADGFQLSRITLKALRTRYDSVSPCDLPQEVLLWILLTDLTTPLPHRAKLRGYFATPASRHKRTMHRVPLQGSTALMVRTACISFQGKTASERLGESKSKAKAWQLLKCHTVYFICMWEASGPERLPIRRQPHSAYWLARDWLD